MKELRVGIVGVAGRGQSFLAPFTCNPYTRVEAVCDINEEGARQCAESFGVSKVYTDYEEMIEKANLDIVVVGTPVHFHVQQSVMALEKGIHVLSEVPAVVSIDEARELVLACKKSSAKYMMAENYCYVRDVVLVREIARAGLFGEMYYGEGEYIHELKQLNEVTRWRRKWQTGINGNTYPTHSLGPLLQWMDDRVVSVSCAGTGHHYVDARGDCFEQEDSTTTMCKTAKGGLIILRLDMLSNRPHAMNYHTLQGTTGCYESPRGFGDQPKIWLKSKSEEMNWMALSDLEQEFLPQEWLNPPKEAIEAGHGGGDYWEVMDFVRAIVDDSEPSIGIHEAMDMTLPGLVSQLSIEQGSAWLAVPDSREW